MRALLQVAGRNGELTAADLAFGVGAAPECRRTYRRHEHGIQCLLTDDAKTAELLAARLDQLNQDGAAIEARMQSEALAALRVLRDPTKPR